MTLYRKNMGRLQQTARIAAGAGMAVAALAFLTAPLAWLGAAAGATMALTGLVGWCPACAVAGIKG